MLQLRQKKLLPGRRPHVTQSGHSVFAQQFDRPMTLALRGLKRVHYSVTVRVARLLTFSVATGLYLAWSESDIPNEAFSIARSIALCCGALVIFSCARWLCARLSQCAD
jgi:Na+-driven multidrug efflux pump